MSTASASLELAAAYDPPRREWLKAFLAAAAGAAAAVLVVLLSFQFFSQQPPLALSLHGEAGQLRIGWSRSEAEGAKLEIVDGAQITTLVVAAPLSDVTYAVRSSDVQVRLTASGIQHRSAVARYVVIEPRIVDLQADFAAILEEARKLQAVFSQQDQRLAKIESGVRLLSRTNPPEQAPARPAPVKETVIRWWR